MYTREESSNGLPRPLRADIQLWVYLVITYIECNYFNFIAAEKENLNKSPGTLPRLLFFLFFCILLLFTFYFQDFPASSLSQTPILSDFPGQQPSLPSRLLCILWHPVSLTSQHAVFLPGLLHGLTPEHTLLQS